MLLVPAFAGHEGLREAGRTLFSPVCHQKAERCIHVAGAPLPVCARCLGIYLGAFAMAWALELLPPARRAIRRREATAAWALLVAAGLMGLDVAGRALAFWSHLPASALTGLAFGAALLGWIESRCAAVAIGEPSFRTDEEARRWST